MTLGQQPRSPADLAAFVTCKGIAAEIMPMAAATATAVAAAAALGVPPGRIIKSLLFMVRGEPVLVIVGGESLVQRGFLASRFAAGRRQVKLADAATVLALTGYPVGGVPPFGHLTRIPVLLDRAVLAWDVVYGGGGDDRTLLRVAPAELARVTGAEWIDLPPPEPEEP